MTSRTPVGRSNHWASGRLVASEVIFTESVITRVLHIARISNVESTVCDNKKKDGKFFKAWKEMRKMEYSVVTSVGQRKNLSSRRESKP